MINDVADKMLDFTFIFMNYLKRSVETSCNKNGKRNKDELTMPQLHLLFCISEIGDTCTITDIVNVTSISKSTISILLTKLAEEGIIQRVHDSNETDKRKVYIKFTSKGAKILSDKRKEIFEYMTDRVSKMDSKDIEWLCTTLPRIGKIMKKYGEGEENNG